MKRTFLLLIIGLGLLFSGCTTYYYSTISPIDSTLKASEKYGFTTTQKDVSATYFFNNKTGSFAVEINNPTNEELYVDWTHSFLIAENRRTGRNHSDTVSIVCAYSYNGRENLQFPKENTPAIWVEAQPRMVVPENSSVERGLNKMSVYKPEIWENSYAGSRHKGKKVTQIKFEAEDTPLLFNIYLTLRSERSNTCIVFDNQFFVSEYLSSKSSRPLAMRAELAQGNTYVCIKKKGSEKQFMSDNFKDELLDGIGYLAIELLKEAIKPKNN